MRPIRRPAVLVFALLALPAVSAESYTYVAAPLPLGCDAVAPGLVSPDPVCVGSVVVPLGGTNVIVSADDIMAGSGVGLRICATDDPSVGCAGAALTLTSCGPVALFGVPFNARYLVVEIPSLIVLEDLTFCSATTGTLYVDTF